MMGSCVTTRLWISLNPYLHVFFILGTVFPLLLPAVLISFTVYSFSYLISCLLPGYGKFVSYFDALLEENFVTLIPRNSMVYTLVIEGDISLSDLHSVFQNKVLNVKCTDDRCKARYPELKQYLATLLGFKIWKDDKHFQLDRHIKESPVSTWTQFSDLLKAIHSSMINRKYHCNRSPWEILLVRNATDGLLDNDIVGSTCQQKISIVACRCHHVMADGKSMIKLFVECLGGKKLNAVSSTSQKYGLVEQIVLWLLFPVNFIITVAQMAFLMHRSNYHPWTRRNFWSKTEVHNLISFTPKLSLERIRKVARKNGVTTSAVVMAMIAGGVRRCIGKPGTVDACVVCPLPKQNHPDILTNHMYLCPLTLPVSEKDVKKRLFKCNTEHREGKVGQLRKCIDFLLVLGGNLIFPLTRLATNQVSPVGITNLAGDKDGFKIGGFDCIDFSMTVGTMSGICGVTFCAFSYKENIRISVIAKETVLCQNEVDKLAVDIGDELNVLMDLS